MYSDTENIKPKFVFLCFKMNFLHKRVNKIILILSVVAVLFSCHLGKTKKVGPGKRVVTVSILPEKTFVEKIAGDDFKINVLIPSGASPAAYTLLPSQLKEISSSVVWFRIGYIGFEYSWKEKIEQANTNMQVVDLSKGLGLIADEKEQHGDPIHMRGVDPHIWLSPVLVKQMAKRIAAVLSDLNPKKETAYKTNYIKFANEIDQLNNQIKSALKKFEGKKIIVYHPSLSYFARDYGLVQYSLEADGKETTPQHMAKIVDLANKDNIKVIYIQSEFDKEYARVFANEINGEIIQVNPLNPDWEDNLLDITNTLVKNFQE